MATYKLGYGFVLDTECLKLSKYGERIALQSKFAKVLVHLVENQERIVSKDELIEQIWHGNFFLGSKGILRSISAIRKALQDDVANPRFILTHRQKGYQFISQDQLSSASEEYKTISDFTVP